ncbi:MAG: DUF3995 domain-containing protein [Acidimicrobiales bacterium]
MKTRAELGPRPSGLRLAQAACVVGVLFAAVSAYWGLGGTWLVTTVRASLADPGALDFVTLLGFAWVPAILKVVASVLPVLAVRPVVNPTWARRVRVLAWLEAAIMVTYGLVLTIAGLLVQADVLQASADADQRAMTWHAYLWDPWFLIWGLLVGAALLRSRQRRNDAPTDRTALAPPGSTRLAPLSS